ncbi:hypothetical protein SUGI_0826390 [Cryptomeria japonica]|uniref:serine/threonine-protein kinase BLUS1 n=1 Tax=Cryptomeria japonica TaxID=3369 RepID=UPI0024146EF7|nr:serine/threonine-protein kinase BLUS1 [Cryptomeria japonica]GLJ40247.1 hypothetical protein SUGI_0826390 [Cryptomeria japonica]
MEQQQHQRRAYPVMSSEYRLLQEIGRGVSATVYEAECIPMKETVAIKSIDLERLNANLDDIRREAQTMSLMEHPNVLRAHCSFIVQQSLWVVMPFMAGGSCQSIMQAAFSGGLEEPAIGLVLKDTLKALDYLHQQGHIHRDVKAGNILIDSKGAVKLADFGVSASVFESGALRHKRNTFVGTPCWMAPEVIDHDSGYDHKADIWSFGITALELAHGHAPFSKFPPIKALLMQLQGAPPAFDHATDKKFSRSFREMVGLCLVKDPTRRPSADKLLKHSFFRHTKTPEYLVKHLLDNLPRLPDRLKMISLKMHRIQDDEDDGDPAGMPHMRRISGWNFNEDNLQFEPMYRPWDESVNRNSSSESLHPNVNDGIECEPKKPNLKLGPGIPRSFSNPALKETCDSHTNQSPRTRLNSSVSDPRPIAGGEPEVNSCANAESHAHKQNSPGKGSEPTQMEARQQLPALNLMNLGQGGHGLKAGLIQKKGRFSVTEEDGSAIPNKPLVHHPLPPLRRMHSLSSSQPSSSSAGTSSVLLSPGKKYSPQDFNSHPSTHKPVSALLPQLQSILQSTLTQQDIILNLLNEMGVGPDQLPSSTSMRCRSLSERESEHIQKIIELQGKVSGLLDEVHALKAQNAQIELQLIAMSNKNNEDEKQSLSKGAAQPILSA